MTGTGVRDEAPTRRQVRRRSGRGDGRGLRPGAADVVLRSAAAVRARESGSRTLIRTVATSPVRRPAPSCARTSRLQGIVPTRTRAGVSLAGARALAMKRPPPRAPPVRGPRLRAVRPSPGPAAATARTRRVLYARDLPPHTTSNFAVAEWGVSVVSRTSHTPSTSSSCGRAPSTGCSRTSRRRYACGGWILTSCGSTAYPTPRRFRVGTLAALHHRVSSRRASILPPPVRPALLHEMIEPAVYLEAFLPTSASRGTVFVRNSAEHARIWSW